MTRLAMTLVLLLGAATAHAVPYELSYGGRLTDSSGKPVEGPVDVAVRFFRSETGNDEATPASVPSFTRVSLSDGVFQITIPLTANEFHTLFNTADEVWIQITDTSHSKHYPRQKFTPVPYALKVPVSGNSITYNSNGELALGNGAFILNLPAAAGAQDKVLKSDGSGGLVWADDLSGGGAGTITSTEIKDGAVTSDDIANGTIVDVDVAAGAAIATSKLSGAVTSIANHGLGDAAVKNVGTTAGTVAEGNHTHAEATTTVDGFLSATDKVRLNAAVTTADTGTITGTMIANDTITDTQIATGAVRTQEIANGTIVNDDISTSAAILGTKISPDFGNQNIATTGMLQVGNPGTACASGFKGSVRFNDTTKSLEMCSSLNGTDWSYLPLVTRITSDVTLTATANDCASIQSLIDGLDGVAIIRTATVTISIPDGTYNCTSEIKLTGHPYGGNIKLIGNTTTPANVTLNFSGTNGVEIINQQLGGLEGIRIVGSANSTKVGISVVNGSAIIGPKLEISTFASGINASVNASVTVANATSANYLNITNCRIGVIADQNSSFIGHYSRFTGVDTSDGIGFYATDSSSVIVNYAHASAAKFGFLAIASRLIAQFATATGNDTCFISSNGGSVVATNTTATNSSVGYQAVNASILNATNATSTNNSIGYSASGLSYMTAKNSTSTGHTAGNDYSPAINTSGNQNSYITK